MIDTAVRSRPRAVGDTLAARARRRRHARFAPRGERHDLSLRMTLDHAPGAACSTAHRPTERRHAPCATTARLIGVSRLIPCGG
jgi:hypothetical protein